MTYIDVRRNWGAKNVRSRGNILSNEWSPYEVDGLVEWKRADLGVTIATGASNVADQSGSGEPAWTQGTGANQPTVANVALLGNQPAFSFNGATQLFTYAGSVNGADLSVALIGVPATVGSTMIGGSGHSFGFLSQILGRLAWNNNADIKQMSPPAGVGFVGVARQTDGVIVDGRANGGAAGGTTFSAVPASNVAGNGYLSVGADWPAGAGSYFDRQIAELIRYSKNISDDSRRKIEYYAGIRYALTVSIQ